MTPTALLDAFATLADAPGGIDRLRGLVLQLAVRGKLVAQHAGDEPADALLERIAEEKARLVTEKKIRKPKPLAPVDKDEVPFEVPGGWAWASTADAVLVVTDGDHQPPPKTDTGVPFLVIGNVSSGRLTFAGSRFVSEDYYASLDWTRQPRRGDLLYTVTASYGIPVPVDTDREFCVQRHIGILKCSDSMAGGYLRIALAAPHAFEFATSVATGTAQKTVPLGGLRRLPIPHP